MLCKKEIVMSVISLLFLNAFFLISRFARVSKLRLRVPNIG